MKAESEAELKAAAASGTAGGMERFVLPTAAELEAEREGAPNLAAIKKRIEDIIGEALACNMTHDGMHAAARVL